jgi:uncharacterized phage protein (TIGR02218 family)
LYTVQLGSTAYRWTSNEVDYIHGGNTFEAAAISRSNITRGVEDRQDVLTIELPSTDNFPRLYVNIVPGQKALMTVQRVHRDDPDQQAIVLFKGLVQSVSFQSDATKASLSVRPLTVGLSQAIPRFSYQALCNHILYDERCKVLQSLFQHTNTATAVSGDIVTVQALNTKGDSWADAGFAQLGTTDFRLILEHTGDNITLLLPFASEVTGSVLDVFAGCKHDLATCKTKFNNVINYGGFAFVPLLNIFQSGL